MEFNGTFLATIITFILFVYLMNKVLYVPILSIMEERKTFIDKNYQNAQENDAKSAELTEQKEVKLGEAKTDARQNYLQKLDEYKNQKAEIVSKAQESANQVVENSKQDLVNLSNEVKESLKGKMTDLANDIVEKVIGYRSEVQGFDENKVNEILYKN